MKQRRKNLLKYAKKIDCDTLVTFEPENLFYMTGFWGEAIGLLEKNGKTTIIAPELEVGRAKDESEDCDVITAERGSGLISTLIEKIKKNHVCTDCQNYSTMLSLKKSISHSIRHRYLVRLSHDPTEAILATAEDEGINTMIVDFSFLRNNRKLLSLSTCDIIGVIPRTNFTKDLSHLIVSYDKGRHSNLGLELAHAISKDYNSKIKVVRGLTQSPEVENEIEARINEVMFDLDLKKIQFEKVYPKTKNMLISSELLKSYNKTKNGVLILGAGNQADTAFSPKALELADKSKKTVFIIRNHMFSEFHTRSFFNVLLQIIKENKILYRTYIEILAGISFVKSKQKIGRYDEEYFESKSK